MVVLLVGVISVEVVVALPRRTGSTGAVGGHVIVETKSSGGPTRGTVCNSTIEEARKRATRSESRDDIVGHRSRTAWKMGRDRWRRHLVEGGKNAIAERPVGTTNGVLMLLWTNNLLILFWCRLESRGCR